MYCALNATGHALFSRAAAESLVAPDLRGCVAPVASNKPVSRIEDTSSVGAEFRGKEWIVKGWPRRAWQHVRDKNKKVAISVSGTGVGNASASASPQILLSN